MIIPLIIIKNSVKYLRRKFQTIYKIESNFFKHSRKMAVIKKNFFKIKKNLASGF